MTDESEHVESAEEKQNRIAALRSQYPTPERIENLFEAWLDGGQEALVRALQEKP